MKVLGFHHTGFTVSDLERSVMFYRDVLGMELLAELESSSPVTETILGVPGAHLKVAFLKAGDNMLELFQYISPEGRVYDRRTCDVGPSHIAFLVSDVDEAYKTLSAKGVQFKSPPQSVGETGEPLRACYMMDPDGITLELMQIGA